MSKSDIPSNTEEILLEIKRLQQSEYVKLAKQDENKKLKQRLYQLRSLEKRGKRIAETLDRGN